MADKIPVKANITGGAATSLGEFAAGDTVPLVHGGLGATTAAGGRAALGVAQDGPRFRSYSSTSPGISNNTITQVPLDAETFDPSSAFNTSTYRFQPAVSGYYDIKWGVGLTNSGASTLTLIIGLLYKNGSEVSRVHIVQPTGNGQSGIQGGDIVFLNGSTDYVDLRAYGTVSSGGLNIQGANGGNFTFLAGHYIGA